MIKVSAPGKLMLFGEHAVVYERPCIVASVEQRLYVSLKRRDDEKVVLSAPDIDIKNYIISIDELGENQPKEIKFVFFGVKNFFEKFKIKSGLEIETKSQFSSQYGLGSSSAVTVSIMKGLAELFSIKINNKELFELCYKTVLDIQGMGSGFDVASAIYGGVSYFLTGGKIIEEIKIKELPIVVGYTGVKADTVSLIKMVLNKLSQEPGKINKIFDEIGKIVERAKVAIENQRWEEVGRLMNLNQELLRKLGVSSKGHENLIRASLKAGAYGAKLSGAGGGDCMFAIAQQSHLYNIKKAIERAGGKVIEMKIPAQGVRVN